MHEDPITREQVEILADILEGDIGDDVLQGFLIMCSRLVDNFGHHRTSELVRVFRTDTAEGKSCLKRSLRDVSDKLGSYAAYAESYPVSIIPPSPAFPMLRIIGIETITKYVYRVLDSKATIRHTEELVERYIKRTGYLPRAEPPKEPVLRVKPKCVHWCSYVKLPTPTETQDALQILPEWSDCKLRATIKAIDIIDGAYMAYNGDRSDPNNDRLGFYGYFFEPLTQDHPPLLGGDVQIQVFGDPKVYKLEKWCDINSCWITI